MLVIIIAEGVETKEEVLTVLQLGVDMIQGDYFSKPLEPNESLKETYTEKISDLASTFRAGVGKKIRVKRVNYTKYNAMIAELITATGEARVIDLARRLGATHERRAWLSERGRADRGRAHEHGSWRLRYGRVQGGSRKVPRQPRTRGTAARAPYGQSGPGAVTVLARIPSVARSAPSEMTGKMLASFHFGSIADQS